MIFLYILISLIFKFRYSEKRKSITNNIIISENKITKVKEIIPTIQRFVKGEN